MTGSLSSFAGLLIPLAGIALALDYYLDNDQIAN